MSLLPGNRTGATTAADENGDLPRFCATCAFADACLPNACDKNELVDLHQLVEHAGPFSAGEYIFREGDDFNAIAAVRAGVVKTFVFDVSGSEHVLGFHLPGEVIGLNAIHASRFPCNAVALDTTLLCRFPFTKMAQLATRVPGLQQQLFQLLSLDIGKASRLAADFSADQRMAAFLVSLSRRFESRGFSSTRFNLAMTRADIANYLRLAPETVSRILKRMNREGLVVAKQREIRLLALDRIEALAAPLLKT